MVSAWFGKLRQALASRFDQSPVKTCEELVGFIHTRAAHVAQTSLYGYLKARMGTQYPKFFENDAFAGSIDIAKARVFVACVADLTVFAVSVATRGRAVDRSDCEALAIRTYSTTLEHARDQDSLEIDISEAAARFARRVAEVQWPTAASGETAFVDSPAELFDAAPVADELKQHDRGIVTNSIRFRWREPRRELRQRLDGPALWADWGRR